MLSVTVSPYAGKSILTDSRQALLVVRVTETVRSRNRSNRKIDRTTQRWRTLRLDITFDYFASIQTINSEFIRVISEYQQPKISHSNIYKAISNITPLLFNCGTKLLAKTMLLK